MWSDVRKICIEYDGIWHFKNIHNQLEEKQKKDKLLNKWCVENGYCLIRIDDKEYVKRKNEILQIVHQIVEDQTNFSSHFIYADDKFY